MENDNKKPGIIVTVRITESEDMGIFMHVEKQDGNGAGMQLNGTFFEAWAREILSKENQPIS